jgi:hypothetical protein
MVAGSFFYCISRSPVYSRGRLKSPINQQLKLEEAMQVRTFMLALALCSASATVCVAQDLNMGTWKLNEAKSQIPAGFMKNSTVVYAPEGDSIKVTTDGTGRDGKPVHTEWTGKFDGKDYPLTGDSTADARSYKKVDAHTLSLANKKDGKATTSGRVVISKDGKSRTLNVTGTDASGNKVTSQAVYDKQ